MGAIAITPDNLDGVSQRGTNGRYFIDGVLCLVGDGVCPTQVLIRGFDID